MRRDQERLRDNAISARVAGADKKGFEDFLGSIDKSVAKISGEADKKRRAAKKRATNSDEAFSSVFGGISQLADARKAQRALDKASREGRGPGSVTAKDLDGRTTVPIRKHKGRPFLPD